jgi:hypothetical protein
LRRRAPLGKPSARAASDDPTATSPAPAAVALSASAPSAAAAVDNSRPRARETGLLAPEVPGREDFVDFDCLKLREPCLNLGLLGLCWDVGEFGPEPILHMARRAEQRTAQALGMGWMRCTG